MITGMCLLLGVVWCDVGSREESSSHPQLSCPPMLVRLVSHRDDVAPPKLELSVFLWREVVQGLDKELLRDHLLQFDVL